MKIFIIIIGENIHIFLFLPIIIMEINHFENTIKLFFILKEFKKKPRSSLNIFQVLELANFYQKKTDINFNKYIFLFLKEHYVHLCHK